MLEFKDNGTWDTKVFNAHGLGCNAISWAPALVPGSLVSTQASAVGNTMKLATGGCDNLVKIWAFEYFLFYNVVLTSKPRKKYMDRGGRLTRTLGLGT